MRPAWMVGQAGGGADAAGELQELAVAVAHAGDRVGDLGVGAERAADDVEEVDQAAAAQYLCDADALLGVAAAADVLVAGHPQADDEVGADGLADGLEDLEREAAAVLEAAAVGVVAPVDGGREELVDEVAPGDDLAAVEAAVPAAAGAFGVGADGAGDVVVLHRLREGAVLALADRAGGDGRQPVGHVVDGAPAHVGDLAHDPAVVALHGRPPARGSRG